MPVGQPVCDRCFRVAFERSRWGFVAWCGCAARQRCVIKACGVRPGGLLCEQPWAIYAGRGAVCYVAVLCAIRLVVDRGSLRPVR